MNTDVTTNAKEHYQPTSHMHAHDVSGLPALITVSAIIFVITCKVLLSIQFSYLQCIKVKYINFILSLQTSWLHRASIIFNTLISNCVSVSCINTVYPHTVHGTQVTICSHNTDNILYGLYVSTFNQVCNFQLSTHCSSLMTVSL